MIYISMRLVRRSLDTVLVSRNVEKANSFYVMFIILFINGEHSLYNLTFCVYSSRVEKRIVSINKYYSNINPCIVQIFEENKNNNIFRILVAYGGD